ncbi:MAG: hypothetical protein ACYDG2_13215 [Ruminiclostridium sp.]
MLKKSIVCSVGVLFLVVCLIFSGCSNISTSKPTEISSSIETSQKNPTNVTIKPNTPSSTSGLNETRIIPTTTSESSKISKPTTTQKDTIIVDSDTDKKSLVESLYKNFYIGEAYKSGFVYIEPFRIERTSQNKEMQFDNYPKSVEFYTIENKNNIYTAVFNSESSVYIPSIEEDSSYHWQGFSEPQQFVLRYKTSAKIDKTSIGIIFFNHKINNVNFGCNGKNRIYSKNEYIDALDEVKKGKENRSELEGSLREINIDDTIVGAKQLCLISIKGTNIKMLLSKYMHMGFENTADVYVVDFINDSGNVIQTYRKYNWVAY